MANYSDATGVVIFIDTNKNHTIDLLKTIAQLNMEWFYGNVFNEIDDKEFEKVTLPYSKDFYTTGRWTAELSFSSFFENLDRSINEKVMFNEMTKEKATELKRRIDKLIVEFSFTDHEPGNEILYSADMKLQAKLKDNELTTNSLYNNIEQIPYTKHNLRKYNFDDYGVFDENNE